MIAVNTAKQIIAEQCVKLPIVQIALLNALNYALAEDVFSPIQFPAFRQSSMDGYAIYWNEKANQLAIQAAMPAGTAQPLVLQKGKAIQVFTGGPVPDGADCVVQKEWVTLNNSTIQIQLNNNIQLGDHIRNIGSDLQKNSLLLQKGTVIQPSHIALMASAGITTVKVIQKPTVGILITGNELVQPGNQLSFGKVYDSNAFTIQAHLKKMGITQMQVRYVADNLQETENAIKELLLQHDIVLITGGVSAGDYDYVPQACIHVGVQPHFHKVKQRPGKPLFFGTQKNKLVFGLPGNPSAVISCLYQYVIPAVDQISGTQTIQTTTAKVTTAFQKTIPLTQFLKGYLEGSMVKILPAQASYQLSALSNANCWIELEESDTRIDEGAKKRVYLFL